MNTLQKCNSCGSANVASFCTEMAIHHAGRENLSKPHVWLFPELLVCFDCGVARLTVPEDKLRQLAEGRGAGVQRANNG
jgi:hypothetical protein